MSKPFLYVIGGMSERVFKFSREDRKALEKEFCGTSDLPGLFEWVYKMVCPLNDKGEMTFTGGNWESQVAFIHAALKHADSKVITRSKVEGWCYDLVDNDKSIMEPVMVAVAAAWEQGLFGKKLNMRAEEEPGKENGGSETSS